MNGDRTEWTPASRTDALTGLPGLELFLERLAGILRTLPQDQAGVAVVVLDLDNFAPVVQALGNETADEVLRRVALDLAGCVRQEDTIARIGRDRFVMGLAGVRTMEEAETVARRILACLAERCGPEDGIPCIGGSLGISLYPDNGGQPDELVRKAEEALGLAKASGRGRFRLFE